MTLPCVSVFLPSPALLALGFSHLTLCQVLCREPGFSGIWVLLAPGAGGEPLRKAGSGQNLRHWTMAGTCSQSVPELSQEEAAVYPGAAARGQGVGEARGALLHLLPGFSLRILEDHAGLGVLGAAGAAAERRMNRSRRREKRMSRSRNREEDEQSRSGNRNRGRNRSRNRSRNWSRDRSWSRSRNE